MKWIRSTHRWVGILSAIFILSLSITGLLLNHDLLISPQPKVSTPFQQHPSKIFAPANHSLYLITQSHLYHSQNNGETFIPVRFPFMAKDIVSIVDTDTHRYAGLKSGLLVHTPLHHNTWQRHALPPINELYGIQVVNGQLILSSDKGMYKLAQKQWIKLHNNTSPMSLHDIVKAIHTGYFPFGWLKNLNSLATICLIGLLLSGLWLFFKPKVVLTRSKK